MLHSKKNTLFRISIIVNAGVLLYAAVHLSGRIPTGPGVAVEWESLRVDGADRSLHSIAESGPAHTENARNFTGDSSARPSANALTYDDKPTNFKRSFVETTTPRNISTGFNAGFVSSDDLEKRYARDSMLADFSYEVADENVLSEETLKRLSIMLECRDKDFLPHIRQRGEFWVLENYVRADHGAAHCHEAVTYTTHAGFEYLDNVLPLVSRWMAPVSLAVHAPGSDLLRAVQSIRYLRDCTGTDLVRSFVTFHLFFSHHHMPSMIPRAEDLNKEKFNCSITPPYSIPSNATYMRQKGLLYPVNVARNVARDAALTYYILASDIELYPSPYLVPKFLNMIAKNRKPLNTSTNMRVFPISIFEVTGDATVPLTKTELQSMLASKKAVPFHKYVCANCHNIPQGPQWMKVNETNSMEVFHVGKRNGKFSHWEPIFIGTNMEPYYDERLSWEGKMDKMTQSYILCVMNYDFMILNNAFLVHKPGIKSYRKDSKRDSIAYRQTKLITNTISTELKRLYGSRSGCSI